jgi:hypothetical protein
MKMSDFEDFLDLLKILFVIVIVAVLLAYAVNTFSRTSCMAQTVQIGFPSRYSFWQGCQIEVKPGQWIPLDSYYFKQE